MTDLSLRSHRLQPDLLIRTVARSSGDFDPGEAFSRGIDVKKSENDHEQEANLKVSRGPLQVRRDQCQCRVKYRGVKYEWQNRSLLRALRRGRRPGS